MKCYVCEHEGVDRDAIGVCIVCGMGLCTEHMVRSDVEIWEGVPLPGKETEASDPPDTLS